jgi:hypothetical protein
MQYHVPDGFTLAFDALADEYNKLEPAVVLPGDWSTAVAVAKNA